MKTAKSNATCSISVRELSKTSASEVQKPNWNTLKIQKPANIKHWSSHGGTTNFGQFATEAWVKQEETVQRSSSMAIVFVKILKQNQFSFRRNIHSGLRWVCLPADMDILRV